MSQETGSITIRLPFEMFKRLRGKFRLEDTSLTAIASKILLSELSKIYLEDLNKVIGETPEQIVLEDKEIDFYRLTMEL